MKSRLKNKTKKEFHLKVTIPVILFFVILTFPQNKIQASWGDAMPAAIWKDMREQIVKQIEGTMMATLKQAAIQTINSTVNNMISSGGQGGRPMFITNWEDFLIREPQRMTNIYMTDWFSQITGGRGNSLNYRTISGEAFNYASTEEVRGKNGEKVAGASAIREGVVKGASFQSIQKNYSNYLITQAEKFTTNPSSPTMNFQEYASDPSQMFSQGSWRAFSSFISNPANNPFGMTLLAQKEYSSVLENYQKINQAQGIAYQGFQAKKSGDMILTPGSTIAQIQAQVEDLGNQLVTNANYPAEVITSLATRLVTKTITQGIGQAQQIVQREINNNYNNAVRSAQQSINNPAQKYKPKY